MSACVIFLPDDFFVELSDGFTFQKFIRKYPTAYPVIYKGSRVWHVPGDDVEAEGYTQFPRDAEPEDLFLEEMVFAKCKMEGRVVEC